LPFQENFQLTQEKSRRLQHLSMLEDVKLVEHIEEGKGILTQNRVCLVYPFPPSMSILYSDMSNNDS